MTTPADKNPDEKEEQNKAINIAEVPSGKAVEVPAGNLAGAPGDALPEPAGQVSKRDTRKPEAEVQGD